MVIIRLGVSSAWFTAPLLPMRPTGGQWDESRVRHRLTVASRSCPGGNRLDEACASSVLLQAAGSEAELVQRLVSRKTEDMVCPHASH